MAHLSSQLHSQISHRQLVLTEENIYDKSLDLCFDIEDHVTHMPIKFDCVYLHNSALTLTIIT